MEHTKRNTYNPLLFSTAIIRSSLQQDILLSCYLQVIIFTRSSTGIYVYLRVVCSSTIFPCLPVLTPSILSVPNQAWLRSKSVCKVKLSITWVCHTVRWRPGFSDAEQEAGTANHEGMAGLQHPLVHRVMETLSLLHATKNNTLSPLPHIKKFTTLSSSHCQDVWLLHCPSYRASRLIIHPEGLVSELTKYTK